MLKSWDVVDVQQRVIYGDIAITRTQRFAKALDAKSEVALLLPLPLPSHDSDKCEGGGVGEWEVQSGGGACAERTVATPPRRRPRGITLASIVHGGGAHVSPSRSRGVETRVHRPSSTPSPHASGGESPHPLSADVPFAGLVLELGSHLNKFAEDMRLLRRLPSQPPATISATVAAALAAAAVTAEAASTRAAAAANATEAVSRQVAALTERFDAFAQNMSGVMGAVADLHATVAAMTDS